MDTDTLFPPDVCDKAADAKEYANALSHDASGNRNLQGVTAKSVPSARSHRCARLAIPRAAIRCPPAAARDEPRATPPHPLIPT